MSSTEPLDCQQLLYQPVILLGASNLTRDFPLIIRLLQGSIESPLEIYTAMGHGRSYGNWSHLLYRALPGISKCEIWDVISVNNTETRKPIALLTDIGNDLIYGQSVDVIFGWIESCISQLQKIDARITITLLPEESISQLSTIRFELTRRLFFPKNKTSLTDLKQRVQLLNRRLSELAQQDQIAIVKIPSDWYGFDPIHYRYSRRATLWKRILSHWNFSFSSNHSIQNRWFDFLYSFYHLQPALKRQWGKTYHSPQPTRMLDDGTRISVF